MTHNGELTKDDFKRMARDLCYDKQCFVDIENAKTITECERAMHSARHRSMENEKPYTGYKKK